MHLTLEVILISCYFDGRFLRFIRSFILLFTSSLFNLKTQTNLSFLINTEDTRKNFRKNGGIECLLDCYDKHKELLEEVISCIANVIENDGIKTSLLLSLFINSVIKFVLKTGKSAQVLVDRGFLKTVVDTTLEKMSDKGFCLKSSYFFLNELILIRFLYHTSEIKAFELFSALLFDHRSNEEICFNTLYALNTILSFHWLSGEITEDQIKLFFKTGIFELIPFIMKETKNEYTASLCLALLSVIQKKGKTPLLFFLFILLCSFKRLG